MEKLAETRMGYNEVTFLSDVCAGSAALLTAPPIPRRWKSDGYSGARTRADDPRHSAGGERLHSHLLNLGLACHFTGFDPALCSSSACVKPP